MLIHNIYEVITAIVIFGVAIFSVFPMYNCLKLISLENRALPPWSAWFVFVPLFGFLWILILIFKIDKSLRTEILQRGLQIKIGTSFKYAGIVASILVPLSLFVPQIRQSFALPAAILWTTYSLILHFHVHELSLSKV